MRYENMRAGLFLERPNRFIARVELDGRVETVHVKNTGMVEALNRRNMPLNEARILILGFSFKKDCPDIRNTKTYDTFTSLRRYGSKVVAYDPVVDLEGVRAEYGDLDRKSTRLNSSHP